MEKIVYALSMTIVMFLTTSFSTYNNRVDSIPEPIVEEVALVESVEVTDEPNIIEPEVTEEISIPEEDIELIALVTMAEAEGECEQGKRLVIDTILNRVDHERFPDTIRDVVYQKNQFTSMWNGRVNRCEVRDDIYQLVLEELHSRTDNDVIFFRTGRYSSYGTPMFKVEHHYFSSY